MPAPTYKMRGQDAAVNGLYDTWLASNAPDLTGALYAGALATPLRDIVVVDGWDLPQPVEVAKAGTLIGTRKRINVIDGANVAVSIADDAANDRLNLTFDATSSAWLPYTKPPASPNAFNFEARNAVSADLAANGFTFRRFTATAGTMVRVGEIYPYRGVGTFTALGPLEYRSSLINGRLYIQIPRGAATDVYYTLTKPATIPTTTTNHGAILWCRAMPSFSYVASSFLNYQALTWFYDSGGVPSHTTGYAGLSYYTTTHAIRSMDATSGATTNDLDLATAGLEDMRAVRVRATAPNATISFEMLSAFTGGHVYLGALNTLNPASFAHAGFILRSGNNGTFQDALPWDFYIDFIRLHQGDLSGVWLGGL